MSDLIRPRSITEIVDAAFQIYRRSPLEFMTAAAIIYVPYLLARLVVGGGTELALTGQAGSEVTLVEVMSVGPQLVLALLAMLAYVLMDAPLFALASNRYLGGSSTAMDAVRTALPRFPALLGASIARGALIGIGLVFLIVPGIFMTALTFAVTQAVVIERVGVIEAFRRSTTLSEKLKRHILGTILLAVVILYAISIGAAILLSFAGSDLLIEVGQALIMILVYPVVAITQTVLYYDARIRREGFDVEWMASHGQSPGELGGVSIPG